MQYTDLKQFYNTGQSSLNAAVAACQLQLQHQRLLVTDCNMAEPPSVVRLLAIQQRRLDASAGCCLLDAGCLPAFPSLRLYDEPADEAEVQRDGAGDAGNRPRLFRQMLRSCHVHQVPACSTAEGVHDGAGTASLNGQTSVAACILTITGRFAHPLTLTMKVATTQAPSCVARELTKCGPMMRRDDVSVIT